MTLTPVTWVTTQPCLRPPIQGHHENHRNCALVRRSFLFTILDLSQTYRSQSLRSYQLVFPQRPRKTCASTDAGELLYWLCLGIQVRPISIHPTIGAQPPTREFIQSFVLMDMNATFFLRVRCAYIPNYALLHGRPGTGEVSPSPSRAPKWNLRSECGTSAQGSFPRRTFSQPSTLTLITPLHPTRINL